MSKGKGTAVVIGSSILMAAVALNPAPSAQKAATGCTLAASNAEQKASVPTHTYFESLAARPDCMAAYSLRDNAELARFTHGPKALGQRVTYDPANDSDPRRQDAAKVVVPAGEPSLRATVRLPVGTADGTTTLVTWDAWFGSEFRFEESGIGNYKNFQFTSPKRIWFEVKTRFSAAAPPDSRRAARARRASKGEAADKQGTAPPPKPSAPGTSGERPDIGVVDARAYLTVGPNVTNKGSLSSKAATFTIRAETWTRYWVLIEQRANDWDLVSMWVADENQGPAHLIDRRQLNVNGSVDEFWLQYNTSSGRRDVGERIGYARNVVMLRNVMDVPVLLQRPAK